MLRNLGEQSIDIVQLFDEYAGVVSIEGNNFVIVNLREGGAREYGTRVIALMVSKGHPILTMRPKVFVVFWQHLVI